MRLYNGCRVHMVFVSGGATFPEQPDRVVSQPPSPVDTRDFPLVVTGVPFQQVLSSRVVFSHVDWTWVWSLFVVWNLVWVVLVAWWVHLKTS